MHFHQSEPATDPGGTLRRGRVVNCGMRSRLVTLGCLSLALFASGVAGAQTPPPAASGASPPGTTTAPAPSAPPLPDSPPPVVVDDPMLTPVPPPQHVITTWDDATRMMRARST